MNGVCSSEQSITTGVPQGFVLGPLLLLLYVNDINNATRQVEPFIFHDDCAESTLFADGSNPDDLLRRTELKFR